MQSTHAFSAPSFFFLTLFYPDLLIQLMSKKSRPWVILSTVLFLFTTFVLLAYFAVSYIAPRWRIAYDEVVVPDGYEIHGIDVSHYQNEIDWRAVSKAKIAGKTVQFAFIRATMGDKKVDKNFKENFDEAKQKGIIRGAYHFFYPNVSAEKQAKHFIAKVRLEPGDLPPVLDYESTKGLSKEEIQKGALSWLKIIEKEYGVKPILYTYLNFKEKYFNTKEFEGYPVWIAHYTFVNQSIPSYDGTWKFWQHTEKGRLEGIDEKVDLNVYNGSMFDLQKLLIQ